jgi:hypothetical protein
MIHAWQFVYSASIQVEPRHILLSSILIFIMSDIAALLYPQALSILVPPICSSVGGTAMRVAETAAGIRLYTTAVLTV